MEILVVTQFHLQSSRGGAARWGELSKFFTDAGHHVTVVCGSIDHASGVTPLEYRGRLITREVQDGADVLRVATPALDKGRPVLRIVRDAAFAGSGLLTAIMAAPPPDIIVGSSPPLFSVAAAEGAARVRHVPFVVEVRDLWPDYAAEIGALAGKPLAAAYALERHLYRAAQGVVAVTPGFTQRLREKGVPEAKLETIPNGVDTTLFSPGPADTGLRRKMGWEGKFVLLYCGVHGPSQALGQVLDAAKLVEDDPSIHFAFVGHGEEKAKLESRAKDERLSNVRFHPQVPRERVPDLLRAADVGLVTLRRMRAFQDVFPAKVFEVMGAGRPVLAAAPGAVAQLVADQKAGIAVAPEDPVALAQAARELRISGASMGANGRALVMQAYDRRRLAERYLSYLQRVVEAGR